ncbi:MAG TPA: choice-of-anchor B family protein [Jiangellaceae bacterium]
MRLRTSLVSVLVATMSVVGGSALAHDDDGKHDTPDDPKAGWEAQQEAVAPGAQNSAPPHSERPDRFAPCVRGVAYLPEFDGHPVLGSGAFPCDGVDLLSYLPPDELGGGFEVGTGRGSDVWGWADPVTGREYVLAGMENGTAIVDITDAKRPLFLAHLPTSATNNLIWRDIKTFNDHAFIVAESANHGMQVLDLTRLRDLDPADAPVTLDEDALYTGFLRAHNIVINEDSGFAYAVDQRNDAEGCGSGMHIVDINDPTNPMFAGCYDDTRVHDAHCVIYDGPDTRFTGRELCITSTGGGQSVGVVDVTDKANPVTLSITPYPNSGFSHQGWLLDGHRYFLHNTESTSRMPQGVDIFDLADLTAPQHIGFFENPAQSTQHNLYQKNRYAYQSNYKSGLRVYDTRNVAAGELNEVAYFDVYPPNDDPGFGFGTWSNYPWFKSGVVAVHGYQGLFLVKPRLGERN